MTDYMSDAELLGLVIKEAGFRKIDGLVSVRDRDGAIVRLGIARPGQSGLTLIGGIDSDLKLLALSDSPDKRFHINGAQVRRYIAGDCAGDPDLALVQSILGPCPYTARSEAARLRQVDAKKLRSHKSVFQQAGISLTAFRRALRSDRFRQIVHYEAGRVAKKQNQPT